jgi:type IV secretory pathway TrbD component
MSSVAIQHDTLSAGHHQGRGRLEVPRASMVVRAFSHPSEAGDRHPVLAVAAKLAAEHQMLAQAHQLTHDRHAEDHMMAAAARTLAVRATACAVLVEQIDLWAAVEFGESRATVLHTETLGQLIDRLAAVWTRSRLIADNDAAPTRARAALHQLSELCTGYDDLVTDLQSGRRRLPLHQTPTGPDVAV